MGSEMSEHAALQAMADAICERRNADDWHCNGLDFDHEMARVAFDALIAWLGRNVSHGSL